MKEKKNQYNKQYSNFQYRSRDISLFLLITRIFGRKGEQLLRAIYTIESYHKSVGEGRISTLRSVSTYTESRLVFQSVSLPVYSERNDLGGSGASFACREREQAATRYRLSINTLVTRTRRNTIGFSNGGRAPSTTDRCN